VPAQYYKVSHDPAVIEGVFVDLVLEAHKTAPKPIILDLGAATMPAAPAPRRQ